MTNLRIALFLAACSKPADPAQAVPPPPPATSAQVAIAIDAAPIVPADAAPWCPACAWHDECCHQLSNLEGTGVNDRDCDRAPSCASSATRTKVDQECRGQVERWRKKLGAVFEHVHGCGDAELGH